MIPETENTASGDDLELEVTTAKSSRSWLAAIRDAEKVFEDYQHRADSIDKLYANLARLSNISRDREFQLFWSNCEVLKPSIYARTPVPVVVPKFKDRRPLYRVSSELMERCCVVGFDLADINSTMILLRDDLAVVGRGSPWVRYESKQESDGPTERVCIEHKDRKDFLHEPARKWAEVGWVAAASYMTKKEMRERFARHSGNAYQDAAYNVLREERELGGADRKRKAKVWEIWSKTENKVVWVTEGVHVCLEEAEPHLKLENFFPCPKPAYATVQRGSLVPVPDMLFYKDQLEEINQLTGRIHALAEAIKVQGFYPSGSGDLADAIEAAVKSTDNRRILIPVSNWAAFGSTSGDPIVWLPIEEIAQTVAGLVDLRRQVIDDVYQIMGLSDIMRGSTEKDETLGAQQLKAQFGSVRIRDKQGELVRVARDLVRIMAEIMAEEFDSKTLLEMCQLEIQTDAEIAKQVKPLEEKAKAINIQLERAQNDPQMQAEAQQNPEEAQQLLQQASQQVQQIMGQIAKLQAQPTQEKVFAFLKDNKLRPFTLDIETDSTIQPDEQAEKEARTEFVTALAGLVQQFAPLLETSPAMAPMVGEIIKFALAPYRVGRELEGKIDEAIEAVIAQSQKPPPNPEEEKLKAQQAIEQQRMQMEQQKQAAENERAERELQGKMQIEAAKLQAEREGLVLEAQIKQQESQQKMQLEQQKAALEERKMQMEMQKMQMELVAKREELAMKAQAAQIDNAAKVQQAEIQTAQAAQQAEHNEMAFEQKSKMNEQAMAMKGNDNG